MCPEVSKDNYGVVLTSYDDAKQESAAGALTKAFKFDAKLSDTILKNTPMVVFEGLTEAVGKLVLEKMKGLSDAGCELKLVQEPFETTKKLTWPKPHAFVRQAQAEAAKASIEEAKPDGTMQITCPKCGEKFTPTPLAAQAAPPAEEPVKGIEEVKEIADSEVVSEAGEVTDNIMELDEFEASLGEIDFKNIPTDDGEEDLDALAGAQAVESETVDEDKSAPDEPEKAPPEPKKTARSTKPKAAEAAPGKADGDSDPAVYRVILSKMRSDNTRNDATEIISKIQGISPEEALKVAGKLIVTAVKDVTEARANEIKNMFTEKGIKVIISKRK